MSTTSSPIMDELKYNVVLFTQPDYRQYRDGDQVWGDELVGEGSSWIVYSADDPHKPLDIVMLHLGEVHDGGLVKV